MSGNPSQSKRRRRPLGWALLCFTLGQVLGQAAGADSLLRFMDGSMLHGDLQQVSLQQGVRWAHPDLAKPVDFRPDNLAWIRFEGARPVQRNNDPTVHIRFTTAMRYSAIWSHSMNNASSFRLGSTSNFPHRATCCSRSRFSHPVSGFCTRTDMDGWRLSREPDAWKYRDGFISEGCVLGRDFELKGSSRGV